MEEVILTRLETSDQGTFGIINGPDGFICHVGEPPWRDNETNISCIPEGKYIVKIVRSNKFGTTYWVTNVQKRTGILQHSGNFCGDRSLGFKSHTYGCQLFGKFRGKIEGQEAVLASRIALEKFKRLMNYQDYTLIVQGV
uniref:DUF5675 domain-containing protein n=1 Tax=viral metagenome TaxID=1070528 RepID=A0A6M3L0K4_9ZZZZ